MNAARFLIWSNEHAMWWRRGGQRGYTQFIEEAGRYERAEAQGIVAKATLDGRLNVGTRDPVTDRQYDMAFEVMVLAPEDIPDGGEQ